MRNSAAVHQFGDPMGVGKGRSRAFACAFLTLAFTALVSAAPPASAKPNGKHHRIYGFGTRALRAGEKGKDVRYLQRALTRLGVATSADGIFGKGTFKSVESFERQHGWPVDGVITKKDARRIRKLLAKRRVSGAYFVEGLVNPTLNLVSRKSGTAKVKVLDSGGNPVQVVVASFNGGESRGIAWNGTTPASVAPDGIYQMKLSDRGSAAASVTGGQTQPFAIHLHAFPVPGPHSFGGRTRASELRAPATSTKARTFRPHAARRSWWTRQAGSG